MTGVRTFAIHPNDWPLVEKFYHERGLNPTDHIRNHRVNSIGHHTFRGGLGYDVIDADLLGGNGDGKAHKQFERFTGKYVDYSTAPWPRSYRKETAGPDGMSEGEYAKLREADKALGTARSIKPAMKQTATASSNVAHSAVKPAMNRVSSPSASIA